MLGCYFSERCSGLSTVGVRNEASFKVLLFIANKFRPCFPRGEMNPEILDDRKLSTQLLVLIE